MISALEQYKLSVVMYCNENVLRQLIMVIYAQTTQIPQFIIENSAQTKVCVCQPRRLAAVGVASRVAAEQNCEIGEVRYTIFHSVSLYHLYQYCC